MMVEAANKYQVMPPLAEEEYQALKADIAERGVVVPVVLDADGNVIDGHHRIRAVEELRAEGRDVPDYPTMTRSDLETEADKRDESWRLNMQRRHLGTWQKRDAIAAKLQESPEWSDNRIAKLLGVDHKTVRHIRMQLETGKHIPKLEKLVGSDGKEYPRQPSTRALTRPRAEGPLTRIRAEGPITGRRQSGVPPAESATTNPEGDSPMEWYGRALAEQASSRRRNLTITRIVRAGRHMEYVVEWSDGTRNEVPRQRLLDDPHFAKCSHCSGYGIVEK
jgi:hypothetical protein